MTTAPPEIKTEFALRHPKREFVPLENGFNFDLALEALRYIARNQALWDQNTWRETYTFDSSQEAIEDAPDLKIEDPSLPVCGTSMCLAGWVGELIAVNWLVDASLPRDVAARGGMAEVVVPLDDTAQEIRYAAYAADWEEYLASRGIDRTKHGVKTVDVVAAEALGLNYGPVDTHPLFASGNRLSQLAEKVALLATFGPKFNDDPYAIPDEDLYNEARRAAGLYTD